MWEQIYLLIIIINCGNKTNKKDVLCEHKHANFIYFHIMQFK